jgi:hypothetical protein
MACDEDPLARTLVDRGVRGICPELKQVPMTMAGGFDVDRQHIMFITSATTGCCTAVRFVRTPGKRCGAGWLSTARRR